MIIRKIGKEEYQEAQKISCIAFEVTEKQMNEISNEDMMERWERYAAFDDNGKMMASMAVIPFTSYFDGKEVQTNGVGDVSTLPQYRRGGAIRGCYALALEDMYNNGDVFSYLYPFSYYFYRKFGYELSAETALWRIALRSLPKLGAGGRTVMYEPQMHISDFDKVYSDFAKNFNMMLKRDNLLWYRRMTAFSPYDTQQWSFVWYNNSDEPKGYLTYVTEKDENGKRLMKLRDFAYSDQEGLSGLLEFLSTFSSQYEFAEIPLPPSVTLAGVLSELQYGNVTRKLEFTGMVRVVNVKKALALAKYKGEGRFTISIDDDTIPSNTGFYAVTFNEEKTTVEITDEEPDIETDIQNFGRLITGAIDIYDTELMPNIKINSNRENLVKAFYKKPLWISDYF